MDNIIYERIAYSLGVKVEELFVYAPKEIIDRLLSTVLNNRGMDINILSNPQSCIRSPYIITNISKAADEIIDFIKDPANTLYIFADFDVDGIESGYISNKGISEVANCKVITYYPNRCEGYGLSHAFCDARITTDVPDKTMVMTVDNGITKVEEVQKLIDAGFKVIITDHHVSQETVPNCTVVDPHNAHLPQHEDTKHLCGAGVAFKLVQVIQDKLGVSNVEKYLPHVAVATLADVMPYHPENVSLIQYGLEIINSPQCPKSFIAFKALTNSNPMTVMDVTWGLAPMMNACGRLGDIHLATDFIFENCENLDLRIKDIYNINERRKTAQKSAMKYISTLSFGDNKVAIVDLTEKKTVGGIFGVLAGKVAEMHRRPSIIVSDRGGEILGGSSRSVPGIDMLVLCSAMEKAGIISSFGGHAQACGVSFPKANLDAVNKFFNDAIKVVKAGEGEVEESEELKIDMDLSLVFVDRVINAILQIIPFDGKNFESPLFRFSDNQIMNMQPSAKSPDNGFITVKSNGKTHKTFLCGNFKEFMNIVNTSGKDTKIDLVGGIKKAFWDKNKFAIDVKAIEKTRV